MSAGSPDENMSWSSAPPPAGVADSASDRLDHFDRMVTMIELIGRLPDLAEDVRNWRSRGLLDRSRGARDGAAIDGYGALAAVARHAFDAVVAGLDRLGSAAVAICDDAGGRLSPDEIAACREIGVVMAGLLERARALIETAEDSRLGAARACVERPLPQQRAG